jgi:hypothetical protein
VTRWSCPAPFTADVVLLDGVSVAKAGRAYRPSERLQPVERTEGRSRAAGRRA